MVVLVLVCALDSTTACVPYGTVYGTRAVCRSCVVQTCLYLARGDSPIEGL